jgi:hypothetical protein
MLIFTVALMTVARFLPQFANSPIILIIMGIVSSVIGLRSGKLLSSNRPVVDDIAHGLKGFGDDTLLLNYFAPSEHLLLSPNGVFSLTAITQPADILADGSSLHIRNNLLTRFAWFFMGNTVGIRYNDAQDNAHRAEIWLQDKTQSPKELPVHPLIVLTHPDATVETNQALIPVLYLDKRNPSLKQYVRRQKAVGPASTTIDQLINSLTPSLQTHD